MIDRAPLTMRVASSMLRESSAARSRFHKPRRLLWFNDKRTKSWRELSV